ncbi:MAG: hypothetical protein HDQ96_00460 [Lachnospiraceae bacterium]|nr:hypothetical protein [Lachnospiraceae bacterium]
MAIAGIENWSGNYLDVFWEDVTVSVNVHEGDSSIWEPRKYVIINLEEKNGISHTNYEWGVWRNTSGRTIHMYRIDSRKGYVFSDEQYETITHEMGHVFGIDDGYKDKPSFVRD